MTTKEILIAAREKVAHGWCQREFVSDDGKLCPLGAINRLGVDRDAAQNAKHALATAIVGPPHVHSSGTVMQWNDAKGRTQAEVLAAFDKAIELAS
jgi:hypothetical protein